MVGSTKIPTGLGLVAAARMSQDFEALFELPAQGEVEGPIGLDMFHDIWIGDFEFYQPAGERPKPHCCVFKSLRTGAVLDSCPRNGRDSEDLFVFYYAPADLSCLLALNFPLPHHVIDLYAEFRN